MLLLQNTLASFSLNVSNYLNPMIVFFRGNFNCVNNEEQLWQRIQDATDTSRVKEVTQRVYFNFIQYINLCINFLVTYFFYKNYYIMKIF